MMKTAIDVGSSRGVGEEELIAGVEDPEELGLGEQIWGRHGRHSLACGGTEEPSCRPHVTALADIKTRQIGRITLEP